MTWTETAVQEAGSLGLWLQLGLHKGFLGEQTKVTGLHTDKEERITYRFFYLGRDDMVGVVDNHFRRTLPTSGYVTQDWFSRIGELNPHAPWEGPEILPTATILASNRLRAEALPVLANLNGSFRAKPKIKPKPKQLVIDFEDRPDVGIEWVPPKPPSKFKLKKPTPFKLKRKA